MHKKHKQTNISQACGEQVASKDQPQIQYPQLKLALDVHAASIVVVRMLDGAKPQPPQTFKPAVFLTWVQKQQGLAHELLHGRRESNRWWHPARWAQLEEELAGWLVERLKVFREVILAVNLSVR